MPVASPPGRHDLVAYPSVLLQARVIVNYIPGYMLCFILPSLFGLPLSPFDLFSGMVLVLLYFLFYSSLLFFVFRFFLSM